MKTLISINHKFMEYSPKELIELIKENSKYTEGFEICIDFHKENEVRYLQELAFQSKKYNFYFQVHGNSNLPIDEQLNFINLLANISNELGYKINVVLHPISANSREESILLTTNYLDELTDKIDNDKIILSLENLNDISKNDRLNKDDITPIVANNENLYLTYDIGHEIADYGNITGLNKEIIPLISNVHIHTISNEYLYGFDHKPIFKDDDNWNVILKGIMFLKNHNYDKSVVFEYDLYSCLGNSIEEKIKSYCASIDYVSERLQ